MKKFWKLNEREVLNTSVIIMYFFLLEIWDRCNNLSEFSISDKKIIEILKISRNTLKNAREKLCDLKLLRYKRQAGHSFVYKIISDSDKNSLTNGKITLKKEDIVLTEIIEEKETIQIVPQKSNTKQLPTNIPTEDEFLNFAKSLEIYDANSPNIDFKIKAKYESWVNNGWKNGHNKPIRNWKTNLKSTLPYLLTPNNSFTSKVPVVKRPKQTYNE